MTDDADNIAGNGGALVPLDDAERTELATLRSEMADSNGRQFDGHWRDQYWHNPGKQARARALLVREKAGGTAPSASIGESVAAVADAPPARNIAASFGVRETGAQVALDTVGAIAAAFGPASPEINTVVAGLPDELRVSMVRELASSYVPPQPEASRNDFAAFKNTQHGAICARRWGADSRRRLADALYRAERFESTLDDGALRNWQYFWHHALGPEQRAAVLDRLTQ